MAKWKCEICGNEFDNFHAQGFDNKIYCPLCYFKKENQELKLQLKGTTHCFDEEEHEKLKKQVEEANEKILLLQVSEPMLNYKKALEEVQQKEFIEYINKTIEELQCDDVDDEEMKGYLIQRIDTFKEILSKYKEIIGYKDEQN